MPKIFQKRFYKYLQWQRFSFESMFLLVLTIVFLSFYGALIFFYFFQWKKVKTFEPSHEDSSIPVSVIIAARNEEHTLPLLIGDLLEQTHPVALLEIIIVNDFSADSTAAVVNKFSSPQVRLIMPEVEPAASSKKKAIAAGVKAAKGELLLITDADCRVDKNWVSTMAAFYTTTEAEFIAAPVKYTHDNSLLGLFQSIDFITLQGITAASVNSGFHTMCNGANLAYTKNVFNEVNGFEGIDKLPTGDDMLLMHKVWKLHPEKVFYLKHPAAIVSTMPALTWKDFFMQRRRWASKALVYKDYRILLVLFFVLLFSLLGICLIIIACIQPAYWPLVVAYFLAKTLIEWPFVNSVAIFYKEQKTMRWFLLFQPLHLFYTVIVGIWSQVGSYEWKGRVASAQGFK